jgi:hypothetical protein
MKSWVLTALVGSVRVVTAAFWIAHETKNTETSLIACAYGAGTTDQCQIFDDNLSCATVHANGASNYQVDPGLCGVTSGLSVTLMSNGTWSWVFSDGSPQGAGPAQCFDATSSGLNCETLSWTGILRCQETSNFQCGIPIPP